MYETDIAEQIATKMIADNQEISDFLTVVDKGMQRQAWLTEQIWMEASKISNQDTRLAITNIIEGIWEKDYSFSLKMMEASINDFKKLSNAASILDRVCDIGLDICKSRIDAANVIGKSCPTAVKEYELASTLVRRGEYELGFDHIEKAFTECDMLIKGQTPADLKDVGISKNERANFILYFLIILLIIVVIILLLRFRLAKFD